MRIALVHDYLNVFGGAERVLFSLAKLYPEAPIYTSFLRQESEAHRVFGDREIYESFASRLPGFSGKLHSPLRFLIPYIWESFNLDGYDVVISSSAAYQAKGVLTRPGTLHVSYIHTPPRSLYGYDTDFVWQTYLPVRMFSGYVSHKLRMYDYLSAQRVDVLVANSSEVKKRIAHYYQREAEVIYPPVSVAKKQVNQRSGSYYLAGGRLVGTKHFDLIVKACTRLSVPLKIYGEGPKEDGLREIAGNTVSFMGRVTDEKLNQLYQEAVAYIAMAQDEDFGITVVEAQAHGVPVICYAGGGYLETVIDGKTGVYVNELSVGSLMKAIETFDARNYSKSALLTQAKSFSEERFLAQMKSFIEEKYEQHRR